MFFPLPKVFQDLLTFLTIQLYVPSLSFKKPNQTKPNQTKPNQTKIIPTIIPQATTNKQRKIINIQKCLKDMKYTLCWINISGHQARQGVWLKLYWRKLIFLLSVGINCK